MSVNIIDTIIIVGIIFIEFNQNLQNKTCKMYKALHTDELSIWEANVTRSNTNRTLHYHHKSKKLTT